MADYNFEKFKVEEVLELVNSGEITAKKAIELEKQGKNRTTLIKELTELLENKDESPEEESNEQHDEKIVSDSKKITLVKNIKYNGQRYKVRQEIEINSNDVESFIKLGVIAGE